MCRALIVFALTLTGLGFPQHPENTRQAPGCDFSEVYRKDGWAIPGLRNARFRSRAKFQNIPGVVAISLSPIEPETAITQVSCDREHAGRIEIEELPIRILDLTGYEYEGRIFAYGVSFEKQVLQNGSRVPLGAASGALFYDNDGTGVFSIYKYAKWPFVPVLPRTPAN